MTGTIYFIQSHEFPRVKIGFTAGNPRKRLKALQTGSPTVLGLMLALPGTQRDEQEVHKLFDYERLHGEWFELSPRLVAYMGMRCWKICCDAQDAGKEPPDWALETIDCIEQILGRELQTLISDSVH